MTAAVNASVQPVLDRYLHLRERWAGLRPRHPGDAGQWRRDLLQFIAHAAVNTVMSGPASGVMAAACTGRLPAIPIITYDMGGTSTDVGLIEAPCPGSRASSSWNTACPSMCRWSTSIRSAPAALDRLGRFRHAAGRRRRGARPVDLLRPRRPEPTITDASLILGRLNPDRLLGVDHPVTLDHVRGPIEQVGKRSVSTRPPPPPSCASPTTAWPAPCGWCRCRAATIRATSRCSPSAGRGLRHGAGARTFIPRCWCRRGPASPTRWAASWPTCAMTMSAPSTSRCRQSTMRRLPASMLSRPPWAMRRSKEGVAVRELRRVLSADIQFRARAILSVGVERADRRRGLRQAFAAAYDRHFGIELAESRRSWSISIPR